jgi:hypothetical protein
MFGRLKLLIIHVNVHLVATALPVLTFPRLTVFQTAHFAPFLVSWLSLEGSVDEAAGDQFLGFLGVGVEGEVVEVVAAVHLVKFAEVLCAVDILVVAYEFLEGTPTDLGSAFLDFLKNLDVAVGEEAVLQKPIEHPVDHLDYGCPVAHHLLLEFALDLHQSLATASISAFLYAKAERQSSRAV